MPQHDGLQTQFRTQLFEPGVAQFAGCHFDGNPLLFRIRFGIDFFHLQGNIPLLTKRSHKGFIAIGLFASQREIHVRRHAIVTQSLHQRQKCHGIAPAATGNQKLICLIQKAFLSNICLNFSLQHVLAKIRAK